MGPVFERDLSQVGDVLLEHEQLHVLAGFALVRLLPGASDDRLAFGQEDRTSLLPVGGECFVSRPEASDGLLGLIAATAAMAGRFLLSRSAARLPRD